MGSLQLECVCETTHDLVHTSWNRESASLLGFLRIRLEPKRDFASLCRFAVSSFRRTLSSAWERQLRRGYTWDPQRSFDGQSHRVGEEGGGRAPCALVSTHTHGFSHPMFRCRSAYLVAESEVSEAYAATS